MSRIRKATVAATAAGVILSVVGGNPATAGTPPLDVAVIQGTGTIVPGIPLTGCATNSHWTFDGTIVLVGDDNLIGNVHYEGDGTICESLLSGVTVGNVSGSVSGSVTWNRTGVHVTVTGSVTVGGEEHSVIAGKCTWTPTSYNPTTTYALSCQAVLKS